jgi:Uma2 family endonuclease
MEGEEMRQGVMAPGATKLRYEDLLLLPEDGLRHELLAGEHVVTPAPSPRHQTVLQNLYLLVGAYVRERGLGRVFLDPLDVLLSDQDLVEPDLLFVSNARTAIVEEANLRGVPDLLVEVVSPSSRRRDELVKRDRYERNGVPEYWVVDPEAESVKVLRRDGDRFARPLLLSARDHDVLESPLLPGLHVPLELVFGD